MNISELQLKQTGVELFGVVALGVLFVVAFAFATERAMRQGTGRRLIWQTAVMAIAALLLVELFGAGRGAVWALLHFGAAPSPVTESSSIQPPIAQSNRQQTNRQQIDTSDGLIDGARSESWRHESITAPAPSTGSRISPRQASATGDNFRMPRQRSEVLPLVSPSHHENFDTQAPVRNSDASRSLVDGEHDPIAWQDRTMGLLVEDRFAGVVSILLGVWLLGMLAIALRLVWNLTALFFLRWCSRVVVDGELTARASRIASELSLAGTVRILESEAIPVPVAFGIFRPTVGLPVGFTDDFSRDEQDAMLSHELAHLSSGDARWQLLGEVLLVALWWHPCLWLLRRRLRLACELAADEASVLLPDGPDHLAGCLVKLGRRYTQVRQIGWSSMTGSSYRSDLGRRVHRLLNLEASPRSVTTPFGSDVWRKITRLSFAIGLVFGIILATSWLRPKWLQAEEKSGAAAVRQSWQTSIVRSFVFATEEAKTNQEGDPPEDSPLDEGVEKHPLLGVIDQENLPGQRMDKTLEHRLAIGNETGRIEEASDTQDEADAEEFARMVVELEGEIEEMDHEMREIRWLFDEIRRLERGNKY